MAHIVVVGAGLGGLLPPMSYVIYCRTPIKSP